MTVEALAFAKINLGLEVLGKRPDGYHEIRSVMAAVSLCDRLTFERADELTVHVDRAELDTPDNLVRRAAELLLGDLHRAARISLRKRIPAAAGLGGASADAAATAVALDRLLGLGSPEAALSGACEKLGSDVPFFLRGGIALAAGRGERLTALPFRRLELVVVVPRVDIPRKTATLYGALRPGDFSDGERSDAVVRTLQTRDRLDGDQLANAFGRPLLELFPELAAIPRQIIDAGGSSVALSGAGPAFYSVEPDRARAVAVTRRLRARLLGRAFVFTCRTVPHGLLLHEEPVSLP